MKHYSHESVMDALSYLNRSNISGRYQEARGLLKCELPDDLASLLENADNESVAVLRTVKELFDTNGHADPLKVKVVLQRINRLLGEDAADNKPTMTRDEAYEVLYAVDSVLLNNPHVSLMSACKEAKVNFDRFKEARRVLIVPNPAC